MEQVKKILFITLSNIGDVVLTLPSFDLLRESFPDARITVLVGPRPAAIFSVNPAVQQVLIYDKSSPWPAKARLYLKLRAERFDLVVDLRNTFLGFAVPARYKTSPFMRIPPSFLHMKDRHLYKTRKIISRLGRDPFRHTRRYLLVPSDDDRRYCEAILRDNPLSPEDKVVVISPGARSDTKRWPSGNFLALSALLVEEPGVQVVLVGDDSDMPVANDVAGRLHKSVLNCAGKTSIGQLSALLGRAGLVITNDSAVSHIASYLDVPVIALFGITDERTYGPWSAVSVALKKDIHCRPCRKSQCPRQTLECIKSITVTDCFMKARDILTGRAQVFAARTYPYRRILVARTDRIGDVLLSTPVLKSLRENYPDSFIAMMTAPATADAVRGNPYLDEVIIYDKDAAHKSWVNSIDFSRKLKKKDFDLAIILHPTNRVHLVTFFAGIRRRVGYDRKLGFLLTDRLKHTKQWGWKHEREYNLDILRYMGIPITDKNLFMPIDPQAEAWAEEFFRKEGIGQKDKVLVIHPGASCPSKIWPPERFARASDLLARKYGFKTVLVAGKDDGVIAQTVVKNMQEPVINCAGKTSLLQLASILKRCTLFISNDSGPVHIASSFGVPVISIFGRNQPGLGPERWGPLGLRSRFLHKDVGCIRCLAHNCRKEFLCLRSISVDDVLVLAGEALA